MHMRSGPQVGRPFTGLGPHLVPGLRPHIAHIGLRPHIEPGLGPHIELGLREKKRPPASPYSQQTPPCSLREDRSLVLQPMPGMRVHMKTHGVRACMHACVHVCVRACVRACHRACTCMHIYTYVCAHAWTGMHAHMHMHTRAGACLPSHPHLPCATPPPQALGLRPCCLRSPLCGLPQCSLLRPPLRPPKHRSEYCRVRKTHHEKKMLCQEYRTGQCRSGLGICSSVCRALGIQHLLFCMLPKGSLLS